MNAMTNTHTYLAHILPSTDLYDGQKMIPLSDPMFRAAIIRSMQEFVNKTQPPILIEHKREGKSYGKVIGLFEDDEGIYVSFEVVDDIREGMENGEFRFVSPTIAWNFKADDYNPEEDNVYPAALLEVSLVSVPRHYTRQQDLQELNVSMMGIYSQWSGECEYYELKGAERASLLAGIDKALDTILG